jgi:hypothetical protein
MLYTIPPSHPHPYWIDIAVPIILYFIFFKKKKKNEADVYYYINQVGRDEICSITQRENYI